MKKILLLIIIVLAVSCKKEGKPSAKVVVNKELKAGKYRAMLKVQDGKELPFVFTVEEENKLTIYNAEEEIKVSDVEVKGDSVRITMPVFDAYLKAAIYDKGNLKGYYAKGPNYKKVSFLAMHDIHFRFPTIVNAHTPIGGSWEVTFSPGTENEYKAIGIFKDGTTNKVTGTFLTETGDYRYLEGVLDKEKLQLSCFDGSHAFLFDALVKGDSIVSGMFYSGNHYKEPWVAVRNENFELTNPNELTYLKEGYDKIDFSFPDLEGQQVSLNDKRFKDKAVIIQIMGSWCPNCLDESKFLTQFYQEEKTEDVEIVALAFENAKSIEKATVNLSRLKEKIGIQYPILIAQIGSVNKERAAEKLPMLNHILSYPTTIYIDKKGRVHNIHTGFNGPATGEKYEAFKKEFKKLVKEISN